MSNHPVIGIVGPCKAGKSTLAANLAKQGYQAHQIAQEHSFAPSMWQKISNPDLLIFLNCSYESSVDRGLHWLPSEYEEQQRRLVHAHEHADLLLETDKETPETIANMALDFIQSVS